MSFTAQEYRLAAEIVATWSDMDQVRITPHVHRLIVAALEKAAEKAIDADAIARLEMLSPQQRRVFDAIVAGRSNKEIARLLGCSIKTIESHRHAVALRLGIRGPAAFANLAHAAGVGPPVQPAHPVEYPEAAE